MNWWHNNREKTRENRRNWIRNNPEKVSSQNKRNHERNYKRRFQENPKKFRERAYKRYALLKYLGPIPENFIETQLQKQNYICGNFFCDCDLRTLLSKDITIEHLIPLKKGGTNDPENLRIWCRSCNCSKQEKSLKEFYFQSI